jgi:predicted nucleotide-binding protein
MTRVTKLAKRKRRNIERGRNVVLELGMVLARLGRPRVAILHKQRLPIEASNIASADVTAT